MVGSSVLGGAACVELWQCPFPGGVLLQAYGLNVYFTCPADFVRIIVCHFLRPTSRQLPSASLNSMHSLDREPLNSACSNHAYAIFRRRNAKILGICVKLLDP